MPKLVSDEKLFAIVLYSAFVNNKYITSVRDVWKNPWVTGTSGALAIGLVGAIVAPFILSAIIYALGFGAGGVAANSFGSWFMSLYGGMIARGSLVSILQSIGAAGLGSLGIFLSSSFGATIGILIGAIGGSKFATYLREIDLNETEEQMLESFVQIEENTYQNNNIIIFKLKPVLLYDDKILKCFFETFKSCSSFASSKLFRFDFIENDLLKLKSQEERLNDIVHNLLIGDYEKSRVERIFHDDYLVGYNLNLSDYKQSNLTVIALVEIWNVINGNIVIEFVDKIRDQVNDQIRNIDINKFRDQVNDQISNVNINGFRDQINKIDINKLGNQISEQVNDQINKVGINELRDQVNDQINKIDIKEFSNQISEQVNNQINKININEFGSQISEQVNNQINKIDINEFGNQIGNQVNKLSGYFHKFGFK
ncbi:hypothetical protein RclHR1_01590011 [Rhizophagus clarus]|uniref:Interferon alpha-inducible protein 27, mitochondrial isoform 1 n=1 Tax=Rhizophagus clarus TaxID=94130 RepID=A0A2Z6R8Y9_9GLOM|nr:hypothetical protein RclHR1_01590011 [Rhizophagus clarus]GES87209.1 interferon alpha-inducible protein 27, mitochondrial isoform 1 [Rhizophagus clarus]